MKKVTFSVPEMSCGHCTSSIEKGLSAVAGVHSVTSDLATKTTTIEPPNNSHPCHDFNFFSILYRFYCFIT